MMEPTINPPTTPQPPIHAEIDSPQHSTALRSEIPDPTIHQNAKPRTIIRLIKNTQSEILKCATIAVEANVKDPMEAYLYPHREEQPEAYLAMAEHRIKHCIRAPRTFVVCAEICSCSFTTTSTLKSTSTPVTGGDSHENKLNEHHTAQETTVENGNQEEVHDETKHEIAGWAMWWRKTTSKRESTVRKNLRETHGFKDEYDSISILDKIKYRIAVTTIYDYSDAALNKASSFTNVRAYNKSSDNETKHDPAWKDPDDYWYLFDVAVSPHQQRKGLGRKMVDWGLSIAQKENIPVMLAAAPAGRKLYDDCGFKEYGLWPWKEGQVWPLMWWLPKTEMKSTEHSNVAV